MIRAWHRWRAQVWLERLVEAKRVRLWSPDGTDTEVQRCRERLLHHLNALGEEVPL